MKKFILILTLFSTLLLAQGLPLVLKIYSTNKDINITNIAQYRSNFQIEIQDEKDVEFEIVLINSEEPSTLRQNNIYKFNWIMVEFDENLSSGNYWIEHTVFNFIEHTFKDTQSLEHFSIVGKKIFSFHYDKKKDSKRYFFKSLTSQSHVIAKASLYTPQSFSLWVEEYGIKSLVSFFFFGLIFMTALYNGALYIYNHEKSFFYYMLMQFFMVGVLFYQMDMVDIYVMGDVENEEIAIFFYFIIVEIVILFMLWFVRSFLETKKYLPFHDKILSYITIVAVVDLVFFFIPILLILQIYTFIVLYIIWVAWLRLKQGYKPARFFLFGWFALALGIFLSEYFEDDLSFDPLLVGSTIEALFLAVAISYKMREIRNSKEEQKELLVHQSRLASMGDMLGNIAHQWRQPLTRLGFILMNIEQKDKQNIHEEKLEEAEIQIEFMSQTINDFRNFYAPNKAKELFSLAEESQNIVDFIAFEKIELIVKIVEDREILNYKNEYKQVLLNLLTNAKDVLMERAVLLPKIVIEINGLVVKISDNGGGVYGSNIQKIFEPYFSTKESGLGIGLYMSKMIVEKNMKGSISVFNAEDGAVFRIKFVGGNHTMPMT